MEERKQRNSSIEFMKVVALFLIILCHSLPLYKLGGSTELDGFLNLRQSTIEPQQLVLVIFSHLGQVGNALFIVPSVYFLLESNEVKKNKIVNYILDTFIVSVIYLVGFSIIQGELPITFIISSLLPTTYNFYWFITCYILLYAIHPWLNTVIKSLEKKNLFIVNICLFILYCIFSFILNGKYYYSHLVGFIVYYFFVAYVKMYLPKLSSDKRFNLKILSISICGFIALILIANYLGISLPIASSLVGSIESFINPFIVGLSISIFNLCKKKTWKNEKINIISSTSLLVFVISNNSIVCSFVKPVLFKNIYEHFLYTYISAICIIIAIITMAVSIIIALVYKKSIQRILNICVPRIIKLCNFLSTKLYNYIASIEENVCVGGGAGNTVYLLPGFNLYDLSRYKIELMGVAAVGVVLCHASQHCILPSIILKFLNFGNICVDNFLFLGGMGMYFSLCKLRENGADILLWYKKRFVRVVVPYMIAGIPFYIWYCTYNEYGIGRFFYHLSGLSFWSEHEGMWYVDLLVPLYLMTPLFAKIIDKAKRRIIPASLMVTICLVISALPISTLFQSEMIQEIIHNIQCVVCRISGYILGYYCGEYVKLNKQISYIIIPGCILGFLLLHKMPYADRLFYGWMLAIPLMLILCLIIRLFRNTKIDALLKWIGVRSLELYLANCILVPLLFTFSWKFGNLDLTKGNYFYYAMVIIIGFPLAQTIHVLSKKVSTVFDRMNRP